MKRTTFRPDADYWDYKLSNYVHDPPDKALKIPGHEERSKRLTDLLELPSPEPEMYRTADWIASGMDRTPLPGWDKDPTKNGAVNYLQNPILTHPIGSGEPLKINLDSTAQASNAFEGLLKVARKDLDQLSKKLVGDRAKYSAARFHYWHHVLRQRLAEEDVGGLRALWHLLPADTRIPDHTIWQHSHLVSALTSCFSLSPISQASLLVYSLTPVQDFIARARKLRDYWTGSLILSWLTFEAMRHVICALGADHILYPSPIHQPLVDEFLAKELGLFWLEQTEKSTFSGVASLPNKFVCLVPARREEEVAEEISSSVRGAWLDLGHKAREMVVSKVGHDSYLEGQFERQLADYWDLRWAACPLVDDARVGFAKTLVPTPVWKEVLDFVEQSRSLFGQSQGKASQGSLYPISHAAAQTFLSAGKGHREPIGDGETGIKCSLHGQYEILRFDWGDKEHCNPRPKEDPFWEKLKSQWESRTDFKDTERLCSIGFIKRIAYRICKSDSDHPLNQCFKEAEGFPSTTEMALTDWLHLVRPSVEKRAQRQGHDRWDRTKRILVQLFHDRDTEEGRTSRNKEIEDMSDVEKRQWTRILKEATEHVPLRETDKYYALLFMDGDGMGKLINGETVASTWEDVIHPDLVSRLRSPGFDDQFKNFWKEHLKDKRLLSPGVHAAISEALADFSLRVVPAIIKRYQGRLIYSGGDDVCAVLPVSRAVDAARRIAELYRQGFVCFRDGDACNSLGTHSLVWEPHEENLVRLMGHGAQISISAGILICHHKKPLSSAIASAQTLLKKYAKDNGGRNAIALELDKRSGGSRRFLTRWDQKAPDAIALNNFGTQDSRGTVLDSFLAVAEFFSNPTGRTVSASLIYRLEELKAGIQAILQKAPDRLSKFLAKQVVRSSSGRENQLTEVIANHLASVIVVPSFQELTVETEGLVVAKFIGEARRRSSAEKGGLQ